MNELVKVEQPNADVRAYRASTEAAEICKEIVVAASSTIQGRRFVSVEGWQAIAIAHGCVLSARDVEKVDGGVRAIGEVRRMSDGQIIATGEGFVGEDEAVWFGGTVTNKWGKTAEHQKRPDYAIRAMAQTRAMSRAGRTAFAHVVVMMNAGLATTPAEEVAAIDGETGEIIEAEVAPEPVKGIHKIKERLRTLINDGSKAVDLESFNALVSQHKSDLETIKEAQHAWWTGDGEDFEGLRSFIKRRREELEPQALSNRYCLIVSGIDECTSSNELKAWFAQHGDQIGLLDGEESRLAEAKYEEKSAALAQLDTTTTGA